MDIEYNEPAEAKKEQSDAPRQPQAKKQKPTPKTTPTLKRGEIDYTGLVPGSKGKALHKSMRSAGIITVTDLLQNPDKAQPILKHYGVDIADANKHAANKRR